MKGNRQGALSRSIKTVFSNLFKFEKITAAAWEIRSGGLAVVALGIVRQEKHS